MRTQQAWEGFHTGGRADVRGEILESWRRSRSAEVDPERLDLGRIEVDIGSPFVRAGAPVLLGMADLLGGSSTSLALADPSGTVAWRWESEPWIAQNLDKADFEPGSPLGEPAAGTNGIGVAMARRRPAVVVGAEHYKQPWHRWTCVAAPVVHPITRRVVGAVNVACKAEETNHMLLVAVRGLVDGVTTALLDAATARQRRMIDAHLSFRAAAAGPVVTIDRQTMIVEDDAAALGLDRADLWSLVTDAGPWAAEIAVGDGLVARIFPVTAGRLDDGVVLVLQRGLPGQAGQLRRAQARLGPLEQAELRVITDVLTECEGNKSAAAARLGISRGTLYQRLRRYGRT